VHHNNYERQRPQRNEQQRPDCRRSPEPISKHFVITTSDCDLADKLEWKTLFCFSSWFIPLSQKPYK
jgi:hypothetical protein